MVFKGIDWNASILPEIDKNFIPLAKIMKSYSNAQHPVSIAVKRGEGEVSVFNTTIFAKDSTADADLYYIERLVKFLLWANGGYEVSICGCDDITQKIADCYQIDGEREFDYNFMQGVYDSQFIIRAVNQDSLPKESSKSMAVGGHFDGCRIGFDAGGSDRKVSAVIDGETVFSEEVVWFPKTNSDPDYHYDGIISAFKTAASKMPRVDAIGISSAGIYIDNRTRVASLFLKVDKKDFNEKVVDIYIRAAKEIGDVPIVVANDGDVTALAGAAGLNSGSVMGIAMGTSEAVGYVNADGNIEGWLNELAFAPIDANPDAMMDEWSGDIGCGVKYFSQDSVIKLSEMGGIKLKGESPAEKLKEVQQLLANGDPTAKAVFSDIGVYLGHGLAFYSYFYDIKHVLMLGRVMSGAGGDIILKKACEVLQQDYPEVNFIPTTPDEKTRRVGQSMTAAGLPEIKN